MKVRPGRVAVHRREDPGQPDFCRRLLIERLTDQFPAREVEEILTSGIDPLANSRLRQRRERTGGGDGDARIEPSAHDADGRETYRKQGRSPRFVMGPQTAWFEAGAIPCMK